MRADNGTTLGKKLGKNEGKTRDYLVVQLPARYVAEVLEGIGVLMYIAAGPVPPMAEMKNAESKNGRLAQTARAEGSWVRVPGLPPQTRRSEPSRWPVRHNLTFISN